MKQKLNEWSRRYLAALQKHLREASRVSLQPARGLGHQAIASGLYKLDVAMMHTQVLAKLVAPHFSAGTKEEMLKRAEIFFVEVMVPIEKTQRIALETRVQLSQLNQTLRERTRELAALHRRLNREIVRRQAAETALQNRGQPQGHLLERPRFGRMQLRPVSHPIPPPQEIRS
jgi:hypothetical protein